MELSEYLQDLRIALAAIGVTDDAAERVIDRERCTLSGVSDKHQKEYITRAHLEMIISSEKARLHRSRETPNHTGNSDKMAEYKKNNAEQYSHTAVTAQDIGQKTLMIENTISIAKLPSDTHTIIISEQPENQTLPLLSKKSKQLRETNLTVRISEKTFPATFPDTKESDPWEENDTILIAPSAETARVLEDTILIPVPPADETRRETVQDAPAPTYDQTVLSENDTFPHIKVPSHTDPPQETASHKEDKKTIAQGNKSNFPTSEPVAADLKNAHPILLGFWLFLLFLPSLFFVVLLLTAVFLTVNLLLLLSLAAVTGFYFLFLLLLLSASLYSLLFVIRYSGAGRINDALTEASLMLVCGGAALLGGYFLYKPVLSCITFLRRIGEGFNKKFFLLVRNLFRYAKKGVGIL